MADASTPDASPKPSAADAAAAPGADGVFSLEELDKIIEAEDPSFKTDIEALSDVEANDAAAAEESEAADQEEAEEQSSLRHRILATLLKPWRRMKALFHLKKMVFKNRFLLFIDSTKTFIRHDLPKHVKNFSAQSKAWAAALAKFVKTRWKQFSDLTKVQKLALLMTFVFTVAALAILSRTVLGGWLPRFIDPLVHSFSDGAKFVRAYKDKNDMQDLFQAFPEVEFYVLLEKVIVNVKPDAGSGPNPMGAFELYLGLDSQDTAIEVKDRQKELLDIVQRAIEGFSYSELSSQMGKARVKSVVRDRVNNVLNQGQVFRIYFNTFIMTP